MHKIKLIKMYFPRGTESCYYDIDSYCSCSNNIYDEMSNWEEVSDEDFEYLKSSEGIGLLQKKNVKMIVLEDITNKNQTSGFVKDIKKAIAESKELQAKRKKKEEENKAKRELAAIERKIKNAKKILEKSGLKVVNE